MYPKLKTFKELIEYSSNTFKDNIAYKYRENHEDMNSKIIEKNYEMVGKDIKAFATSLLERGYENKTIAIIGSNRYEWAISYFSIQAGGMVAAPMDRLLPGIEIESLIERSNINAIIFEKSYLNILKQIKAKKTNNLNILICMDDIEDEGVITFNKLLEEGYKLLEKKNNKYNKIKIDDEKMSVMLFTSGTTDKSKIVMLSQKNILSNICEYPTHFKMLPKDTLLSILPIHHTFECSITIIYGFYCGATVAFSDGLKHIVDNLKEYEVTIFVAVPLLIENMYKKIKKEIELQGKTKLVNRLVKISSFLLKYHIDIRRLLFKSIINNLGGKLRIMLYGAASMDKETIQGFYNLGLNSIQGYGLTETSPVLVAESEKRHCIGSAGFPLDNVEIKINNPNEDGIGEIVVKGPNVFLGYYEDKEKTDEAFNNGWFRTGDLGYLNSDNFLFITGRQKDIIVLSNGKNIFPQEIETLINRIPYIKESLVFARKNSNTDTLLVSKIVYDEIEIKKQFPDKEKSEYEELIWSDILKINQNLPSYKKIKKIIITNIELCKTTTQKVKRYQEIKEIEDKEEKNSIIYKNKDANIPNEIELKIIKCMQNVLDLNEINVDTDFFEAGGDSLSAIDLQIDLEKENILLNTQEIFDNSSARKIYNYITNKKQSYKIEDVFTIDIKSEDIKIKEKNNILLTGVTGFLGIHILHELLETTENNIYCIIRQSDNILAEERIKNKYKYYYENESIDNLINNRVFIFKGNLTKNNFDMEENQYKKLINNIDIIINTAATVTHYGNRQYSYESNVVSVNNILKFAEESGAVVNHISTIGLAGNNLVDTNECIKDSFSENDLIIGQKYEENVYLSTKLEAEKNIIEKIKSKKIYANILRVGNLMNRYSDNLFQDNKDTNAFQNKMKEIIRTGIIPTEIGDFSFDLTPVDMCAKAIVKLSLNEKYNNVYHVLNSKELTFKDILEILNKLGIKLKSKIPNKDVSKWLINDMLLKNNKKIIIDSKKTRDVLEKLDFIWEINEKYYIDVFKSILELRKKRRRFICKYQKNGIKKVIKNL